MARTKSAQRRPKTKVSRTAKSHRSKKAPRGVLSLRRNQRGSINERGISKKTVKLFKKHPLSGAIFILVFAAVGGYIVSRSFAAPAVVLTSVNLDNANSSSANVVTETVAQSKRNTQVVEVVNSTQNPSAQATFDNNKTLDPGVYKVCISAITPSSQIGGTIQARTLSGQALVTSLGESAYSLAANNSYTTAGCTVFTASSVGANIAVVITERTPNSSIRIGHLDITRTGNIPSPTSSSFVSVCGIQLCESNAPFKIHGATTYGTLDNPAAEISLAQNARINTLELVEFEKQYHTLSDTMSEATWSRVDKFIAAAGNAQIHVILNLSSYAQSLQAAGQTATQVDWQQYLSFIANRTNTVTGKQYKDDSTIAMVELWGEICYPGEADNTCPAGTSGSAADMQNFFHRSEAQWLALAPNILISSGGFSHLNPANSSGIPWQNIVADQSNAVCDIEVNSPNDVNGALGKFTNYCKQLGKPWFLSAWSSCYNKPSYPFFTPTDASMAAHAQDMYNLQNGGSPAAYAAVGSDFWNLRDQGVVAGNCSLSPSFPLTWKVLQNNS